MNKFRTPLIFLMAGLLLLMGGCSKHYVDVYINEECDLVTLGNGSIETLLVFKGDYVIFNNLIRETDPEGDPKHVDLTLPEGMFDESGVSDLRTETGAVRVKAGKRIILEVISDGPFEDLLGINGPCPSGTPKVKVGEEP